MSLNIVPASALRIDVLEAHFGAQAHNLFWPADFGPPSGLRLFFSAAPG
jgi:hypothetical protein